MPSHPSTLPRNSGEPTPGPWRLHDMERATIVAGKPGGEVANCLNGFGDQDANARLIAAAPDMAAEIARLRAALKFYANSANYTSCSAMERGPAIDEDDGNIARAALEPAK